MKMTLIITLSMLLGISSIDAMHANDFIFKESINPYSQTIGRTAFLRGRYAGTVNWSENIVIDLKVEPAYRNQRLGAKLFCDALKQISRKYKTAHWYAADSVEYYYRFGALLNQEQEPNSNSGYMYFDFTRHGDPYKNESSYHNHPIIQLEK